MNRRRFIGMSIVSIATSIYALPSKRRAIMNMVYIESKKYTRFPTTIAAICMTESSLGKNRYNKEGSLGLMQLQVDTVRDVIRWFPVSLGWMKTLRDHQIATYLLGNDKLSIKIASLLFEWHRKRHGYFGAISRYNGGANNWTYYNKVQKNKKLILKWRSTS